MSPKEYLRQFEKGGRAPIWNMEPEEVREYWKTVENRLFFGILVILIIGLIGVIWYAT